MQSLKGLIFGIFLTIVGQCQAVETSNRMALVIGIGVYANPEIPALTGVSEDVKSARSIAKAMGISDKHIKVLSDEQASKAGILTALSQLGEATPEGSRVFVYYSGHGSRWLDTRSGECVEGLLTYDSQAITNKEVAAAIKKISEKADKLIVMFDACHSQGVTPNLSLSRSAQVTFVPKFYQKAGSGSNSCSQPTNMMTRGLLGESTRLGALAENIVQITSSRSTEVSFDEPGKGGLATQGVRDCLLGESTDLDASGAVSMAEVQQCAQIVINRKLQNAVGMTPHHVTVSGNRNLIPVQRPKPPVVTEPAPVHSQATVVIALQVPAVAEPVHAVSPATPATASEPQIVPTLGTPPVVQQAASSSPVVESPSQVQSQRQEPPTVASLTVAIPPIASTKPPKPEPQMASLATLQDILQQRNPKRVVDVYLSKAALKIGQDSLDLKVKSSHDGYVYLVMLGSDSESFYVLFPNGLDGNNRILAKQTLRLPKPDWQVTAAGPAGTDQLLVLVSDSPRTLDRLTMAEPTATVLFTYALNNLGGREALIKFLTGDGISGKSESFGAKLLSVKELP